MNNYLKRGDLIAPGSIFIAGLHHKLVTTVRQIGIVYKPTVVTNIVPVIVNARKLIGVLNFTCRREIEGRKLNTHVILRVVECYPILIGIIMEV